MERNPAANWNKAFSSTIVDYRKYLYHQYQPTNTLQDHHLQRQVYDSLGTESSQIYCFNQSAGYTSQIPEWKCHTSRINEVHFFAVTPCNFCVKNSPTLHTLHLSYLTGCNSSRGNGHLFHCSVISERVLRGETWRQQTENRRVFSKMRHSCFWERSRCACWPWKGSLWCTLSDISQKV